MAGIEDLVNLGNLITQVRGQSQTTTKTGGTTRETTQTDISDEGINELIRNILAGPGGVQDVGGAARRAGVYDSPTEELLLGNLYSRAAAQGELARAPTVRETTTPDITTTTEIPGMGFGPLAGTLAATTLAAPLVERAAGALAGGGGIGDIVGSLFGGGGGQAATAAGAATTRAATGAATSGGGGFLSGITGASQNRALGALGSAGSAAATSGSAVPGGFMSAVDTGGVAGIPGGGIAQGATSFLGGLQGQKLTPVDVGAAIASGFAAGGPVGAGVAAFATVFGNLLGGATDSSVICTALMERGLLDKKLYAAGSKYLQGLSYSTVSGYHYWAVGIADKIRNDSKFWTAVCLPLARSRTALLASEGTALDHIKYPFGTLTKYVGEPSCWLIGKALSFYGYMSYGNKGV